MTHLICAGSRTNETFKEFKEARTAKHFICHPAWLEACQQAGQRVPENTFPHTYHPGRALTYTTSFDSSTLRSAETSDSLEASVSELPAVAQFVASLPSVSPMDTVRLPSMDLQQPEDACHMPEFPTSPSTVPVTVHTEGLDTLNVDTDVAMQDVNFDSTLMDADIPEPSQNLTVINDAPPNILDTHSIANTPQTVPPLASHSNPSVSLAVSLLGNTGSPSVTSTNACGSTVTSSGNAKVLLKYPSRERSTDPAYSQDLMKRRVKERVSVFFTDQLPSITLAFLSAESCASNQREAAASYGAGQ